MDEHSAENEAAHHAHEWVFDGYFWHRCSKCGAVS